MKSIIAWFVDNPVASNLLMLILVGGGLMSLTQLNQEQFPDVELGIVQVSVPYLGAAPEEVEEGVCFRVEEALESAESIFRMTSRAREGNCTVTLEIDLGSDLAQALNEIKSKVDSINTFPEETERPIISELTVLNQVLHIVISGETDERTLKQLAMDMREDLVAIAWCPLFPALQQHLSLPLVIPTGFRCIHGTSRNSPQNPQHRPCRDCFIPLHIY